MRIKAEQREKRKKNNSKMIVSGRSIFTLARIKAEKAIKAHERLQIHHHHNNSSLSSNQN